MRNKVHDITQVQREIESQNEQHPKMDSKRIGYISGSIFISVIIIFIEMQSYNVGNIEDKCSDIFIAVSLACILAIFLTLPMLFCYKVLNQWLPIAYMSVTFIMTPVNVYLTYPCFKKSMIYVVILIILNYLLIFLFYMMVKK